MGLFSSIAGIFGASKKAKAAKNAANAQIAYLQQGVNAVQDARQRSFDVLAGQGDANKAAIAEARAYLNPFVNRGYDASAAIGELLGLSGGDAQAGAIEALKASPLFQSLFRTGEEAVLSNASATGGLRGGNTQRSLADFGSDTLAKVIQQQIESLSGLSTQGLTAAGGAADVLLGGAGLNTDIARIIAASEASGAGSLATLFSGQGAAKAGGILGKANAQGEMFGNIANGIGGLAGAFLPTSGMGGTIRGLI